MDTISLSRPENHIRGPVVPADFKTYILPLLFFKRVSDVDDEGMEAALEELDGDVEYAQFPGNHRSRTIEGCHWSDVRSQGANIGHRLQKAMRRIEQGNPETHSLEITGAACRKGVLARQKADGRFSSSNHTDLWLCTGSMDDRVTA